MAFFTLLVGCVDGSVPLNPDDDTEFLHEVPQGATAGGLAGFLVAEGYVGAEWQYKLYTRNNPEKVSCLKAGKFKLRKNMSLDEVFETLCGVPLADDVPFTVVEGWRIRDIDAALTDKGLIEAGQYKAIATTKDGVDLPFEVSSPTLEGYLWPETYMVSPDRFDVTEFIERQLATFDERFATPYADRWAERGLHDVVVMASLLEREEPKPPNRPIVAGILYKRLGAGWQLGVDATSRYTLENWNDRKAFLTQLRDPEDPYNTRIHKGLPPTAIGNPSLPSLEAALEPVESEYWFYLHDGQQNFHGGRDAAEHERNRARYNVY